MTAGALIRSPTLRTLALAATVIALVAVLWQSDEPTIPMKAAALRGEAEPDSFVVGGRYLSFSETGRLVTRIKSQRIEQFESDKLIRMQQPQATLFGNAEDGSWEVEAEEGEFLEARGLMHLTGEVRIVRLTDPQGPMSLSTQALTLDNENRTIYTNEPVEIIDALGITRATGMKAWLDERILELNAQVEGRYETGK
jgi:lipopolysaccharide export system protein LptC